MDVRTTPGNDRIDRIDVTVNAYEVFWDCVESGSFLERGAPADDHPADDAYAQFWLGADF